MSDLSPNEQQRKLIHSIDGLHLVDAGAGTGKTFTITRRYANILSETEAAPDDILLVTFTRAAAAEMRDRIVRQTDYDVTQLQHAPIGTFHAHALRLLRRFGHNAPKYLGIDDHIASSVNIVEDGVRERTLFGEFVSQFTDRHPEYEPFISLLYDPRGLASLVAELAAKGVVPTAEGWYRNTGKLLSGDREEYFEAFERANTPNDGANGPINSDARNAVGGWDESGYTPDAPSKAEIHDDPRIEPSWIEQAYDENRSTLFEFVHDVYFEYLRFLIQRNVLTQGFVLVLAYVLLCENDAVRSAVGHEYVTIDEFQDTNVVQFKLALLLSQTENICVVGDWKQSIYGFQYTTIENIRNFESRIKRYKDELNGDRRRINYDVSEVKRIPLVENYRSTESILERADSTLTISASSRETVSNVDIVQLEATNYVDNSKIERYTADDEYDLILDRIQHVVGNDEYAVERYDEPRPDADAPVERRVTAERERLGPPSLDDIAILTRKRKFARELLRRAEEYGVPMAYRGGLQLFDTPEAKLILAWLRISESNDNRGWAVALERAGYPLEEAKRVIEERDYPHDMVAFRETLRELRGIGGFAQTVLKKYGRETAIGDSLIDYLTDSYENGLVPRGEVIDEIVSKMESGETVEVDMSPGTEAVTLQTIHSVKGLEYPIVLLSNLNQGSFPHYGRGPSSPIVYDEALGLRQRRRYAALDGKPYVYGHWQYDLLKTVLPSSYDEERRLFYVAVTRAKRHVLLTAGEEPSSFFDEFPAPVESLDASPEEMDERADEADQFTAEISHKPSTRRTGVHSIMDDSVYEGGGGGRGAEFGQRIHDFAEAYAEGDPLAPETADQTAVATFIDGLEGDLYPEETVLFPINVEPHTTLTGIVDLLHVTPERVDIVDWKTDQSRRAHQEYRLQLSVYYHVLRHEYPERVIRPIVFYTADDDPVVVDPAPVATIEERVRNLL